MLFQRRFINLQFLVCYMLLASSQGTYAQVNVRLGNLSVTTRADVALFDSPHAIGPRPRDGDDGIGAGVPGVDLPVAFSVAYATALAKVPDGRETHLNSRSRMEADASVFSGGVATATPISAFVFGGFHFMGTVQASAEVRRSGGGGNASGNVRAAGDIGYIAEDSSHADWIVLAGVSSGGLLNVRVGNQSKNVLSTGTLFGVSSSGVSSFDVRLSGSVSVIGSNPNAHSKQLSASGSVLAIYKENTFGFSPLSAPGSSGNRIGEIDLPYLLTGQMPESPLSYQVWNAESEFPDADNVHYAGVNVPVIDSFGRDRPIFLRHQDVDELGVEEGSDRYFVEGYKFSIDVDDQAFAAFCLPDVNEFHDTSELRVEFEGMSHSISFGEHIDFTSFNDLGVKEFKLIGFSDTSGLRHSSPPAFGHGIQFMSNGVGQVLVETLVVPEGSSLVLQAISNVWFVVFLSRRRSRMKWV